MYVCKEAAGVHCGRGLKLPGVWDRQGMAPYDTYSGEISVSRFYLETSVLNTIFAVQIGTIN